MRRFAISAMAVVMIWPAASAALTRQEISNIEQTRRDLKACEENNTLTDRNFQRLDRIAQDLLEDKLNPALTQRKLDELESGVEACIERFGLVALVFKLVARRIERQV